MDQNFDNDRIIKINIEEEMKSSYIDYSMSVIVARALPSTPPYLIRYDEYQQRLDTTL